MSPAVLARPPWKLRAPDPAQVAALARAHGISDVAAALLVVRGIVDPKLAGEHLEPRLNALHDPSLLPGMRAATERVLRAIELGETILVHGDYDVDGVTGTTLLVRLFRLLGARVAWHIPNRFTDGYAFGAHSVAKACETGAKLVVSVDNGTSSRATIAELLDLGVATIVTDHHEPPPAASDGSSAELPPAVAIVNPKLADSDYPFRELCGGAVAFKLAWGICQAITGASRVRTDLKQFLVDAMGYVAIATVCDVVPLVDENRILSRFGLKSLAATRNPGIRALFSVAGLDGREIEADDLAFQIGPRINAAGRLGSARTAVELLLCDDPAEAARLATEIDARNAERKRLSAALFEEAARAAERFSDAERHPVLVLAGEGWHQGLVGIVAARLAERFSRPALVIGLDGGAGRGSARSIAGFSVLDALHGGAAHMERYGGHEQAAGCEVRADSIDALRDAVCARAHTILDGQGFAAPPMWIDREVAFETIGPALMREIARLAPFGERNEKPVLLASDLRLAEPPRTVGSDGSHLVLQLRRGAHVLKAVFFGAAARASELRMGEPVHAVGTPRWNVFRGERKLELELADFRTGARPAL
jgi:single-stranded-DNA-specific exonuclease